MGPGGLGGGNSGVSKGEIRFWRVELSGFTNAGGCSGVGELGRGLEAMGIGMGAGGEEGTCSIRWWVGNPLPVDASIMPPAPSEVPRWTASQRMASYLMSSRAITSLGESKLALIRSWKGF